MGNSNTETYTDEKNASSFDQKYSKLAPIKDALHLCMRMVLAELPDNANVLCVGVGTGAELLYLAKEFPGWRFTAVEPAEPMLKICREKAEETGIDDRCIFHNGYLDTLPDDEKFDAVTSALVTHFILDIADREKFYQGISTRLKPNGFLINAEMASDMNSDEAKALTTIWKRMLAYSDIPAADYERASTFTGVKLLPQKDVERLMLSNGFEMPVLFLQTLFIHAWFARKTS